MEHMKFKAHPWHGINPGKNCPQELRCFIEVVPGDQMKYEIDKESGYLKVDRPNIYSSVVPLLYGFIPMTYSSDASAEYCMKQTGLSNLKGDGDPIDIIVLSDRYIPRGDIIVEAIPIGGLRMIDKNETDDKLLAVLKGDQTYGQFTDISQIPRALIKRIKHYFLTYKNDPETETDYVVDIFGEYGSEEAYEVINAGLKDYKNYFGQ
jgi:inorganic pyrophosphatase